MAIAAMGDVRSAIAGNTGSLVSMCLHLEPEEVSTGGVGSNLTSFN